MKIKILLFLCFVCSVISQSCDSQVEYYTNALNAITAERDSINQTLTALQNKKYYDYFIVTVPFVSAGAGYSSTTTSSQFVNVNGLSKVVTVSSPATIKVTLHGSVGMAAGGSGGMNIAVYINGTFWESNNEFGIGSTTDNSYVSTVAFAVKDVTKGDYTIEAKMKSVDGKTTAYIYGGMMLIEVFYK